jgi:hypothetical protein
MFVLDKTTSNAPAGLSISALERDLGIPKDTVRMWERRYGFPKPVRDSHGERIYPADQVARLSKIRRLMDRGHRPGQLMTMAPEALSRLLQGAGSSSDGLPCGAADPLAAPLALLRRHDVEGIRVHFDHALLRDGLQRFVTHTIAPLCAMVGEAWAQGRLEIFEEHLFTEQVQSVLRAALAALPRAQGRPRVLLTTFPGEHHQLGLLMAQALLSLEGAHCISLGTQTPVADIASAAAANDADVVALSFSGFYPVNLALDGLKQLLAAVPPGTEIWTGGSTWRRTRRPFEGITLLGALEDIGPVIAAWRQRKASRS